MTYEKLDELHGKNIFEIESHKPQKMDKTPLINILMFKPLLYI